MGMANKLVLIADAKDEKSAEYRFQLEFYVFQEGGNHIAYSPALDISTSGSTFNDAIANFYERFQLYVEYCVAHGTLHNDLLSHGWKFKKESIIPPSFSVLMRKPEMKRLLDSNLSFERIVTPARFPAQA